ncbi:hypothetical protein O0544_18360 [Edwardsiella anguillarum]|nr:hypothetical protein [Edwardsiella anguillarum]
MRGCRSPCWRRCPTLPVLVSDIPANQEVGLSPDAYFPRGNVAALATALRSAPRCRTRTTARCLPATTGSRSLTKRGESIIKPITQ